eukprot:2900024-Amphidinium_carterae.1
MLKLLPAIFTGVETALCHSKACNLRHVGLGYLGISSNLVSREATEKLRSGQVSRYAHVAFPVGLKVPALSFLLGAIIPICREFCCGYCT